MANNFSLDLSAWVKKAKGNVDAVTRKIVMDVGARIVMRSPVGDGSYWKSPPPKGYAGGRFRGSWQLGVGAIPSGDPGTIDPSGGGTVARALAVIPVQAGGKIYYYSSNLPYSMRIEEGWSRQAPQGVVALTVLEWNGIVRDAAKAVNP